MKGQVFSQDFFVALSLFLLVFGFLVIIQNAMINQESIDRLKSEIELSAIKTADVVVKTKGFPENWELDQNSTISIGLADSDRRIDNEKLSAFINMSYSSTKPMLNIEGYDYFFQISGTGITKGTTGGDIRVVSRRIVIYNDSEHVMEFMVWK